MPLFCRHNRLTQNCAICSRELGSEHNVTGSGRAGRTKPRTSAGAATPRRKPGVVTRRAPRAADDGYRNPLVPGLHATVDAERLASALAWGDARLEPPGPHPAVAAEPDLEEAIWLAFLLALADPDATELHAAIVEAHPTWAGAELPELPGVDPRTVPAYRAWAERSGSQADAFHGEPGWSPERRFGRVFERLALPGLRRTSRFELLVTLGAAERVEVAADGLHPGKEEDATTIAAKRVLVSGDPMLLERRAADLASACGVHLGALDRALAVWGRGDVPPTEAPAGIRSALGLR
jgi:hypothetical protein